MAAEAVEDIVGKFEIQAQNPMKRCLFFHDAPFRDEQGLSVRKSRRCTLMFRDEIAFFAFPHGETFDQSGRSRVEEAAGEGFLFAFSEVGGDVVSGQDSVQISLPLRHVAAVQGDAESGGALGSGFHPGADGAAGADHGGVMEIVLPDRRFPVRKLRRLRQSEFAPPVGAVGEGENVVRFQTAEIIVADFSELVQTSGIAGSVAVVVHFAPDDVKPVLFKAGGVAIMEDVGGHQPHGDCVALAVGVAGPGVAADPEKAAVGEDKMFHDLPEILRVKIQLRRRLLTELLEVEVKHRQIRKADHHVPDIQITVMIQRIVRREVESDVPFPQGFSPEESFRCGIQRMRDSFSRNEAAFSRYSSRRGRSG